MFVLRLFVSAVVRNRSSNTRFFVGTVVSGLLYTVSSVSSRSECYYKLAESTDSPLALQTRAIIRQQYPNHPVLRGHNSDKLPIPLTTVTNQTATNPATGIAAFRNASDDQGFAANERFGNSNNTNTGFSLRNLFSKPQPQTEELRDYAEDLSGNSSLYQQPRTPTTLSSTSSNILSSTPSASPSLSSSSTSSVLSDISPVTGQHRPPVNPIQLQRLKEEVEPTVIPTTTTVVHHHVHDRDHHDHHHRERRERRPRVRRNEFGDEIIDEKL